MPDIVITLMPVVLGFVIGWFTNYLAVVMLFRPYRPRRVLGFNIQGIFPRLQPQLAEEAGELVERELFRAESVQAHLDRPTTRESLRKAVQPAIGNMLITPPGTPRDWLRNWGGDVDTDHLVQSSASEIARAVVRQLESPAGKKSLREIVKGQVSAALERPVGDWLTDIAPPADKAAPGDATTAGTRVDALRRLMKLPAMMDWLATGDLPARLAESIGDALREVLGSVETLDALVPDDARQTLLGIAHRSLPELQKALSAGLTAGPLRTHVIREATDALRQNLQRRIEPGTLLARFLSPERLLSLAEGTIEKLPDQIATVVAAPGAAKALDDVMRGLLDNLLALSPTALHEQMRDQLGDGRWLVDRMRELVASEPLQQRVAAAVDGQLGDWLDRPTGDLLSNLRGGDDPSTDIADRVIARIDLDELQPRLEALAADQLRGLLDRPMPPLADLLRRATPTSASDVDPVVALADSISDRLIDTAVERVADALPALDIRGLVRDTVAAWPPEQLEQAIQQVARNHLRFVTWVGGILGAMIGSVQILIR